MTKNIVKKGTFFMGLTKKQIIIIVAGGLVAIGSLALFIFVLNWNIDITMTIIFFELMLVIGLGVININGMSLFKYFLSVFKTPVARYYSTKGIHDNHEE